MTIRACMGKLGELKNKILFKRKLRQMDRQWYDTGASSWGLFPPSFYYTHTEEEIERIRNETLAQMQEIIDKLRQEL